MTVDPIVESHLRENRAQIVDVHLGSEALAAPPARRSFSRVAGFLVQLHTQLRRALKDVKELAEGQVKQPGEDGDRVKNRQETISSAAQPLLRSRERKASD